MLSLPTNIQAEIRELFTPREGQLSDAQVKEIADNLLSFALHIGGDTGHND